VTIQSAFAHRIPDSVSYEVAALLEPLSVGIWASRKAQIVPGSRVLIAGAGPIGVIATQAARAFGAAEVIVTDPVPERREMARRFGATHTMDPITESVADLGVDAFRRVLRGGASGEIWYHRGTRRRHGRPGRHGRGRTWRCPYSVIQTRELQVTGIFRYTEHLAHRGAPGRHRIRSILLPWSTGRFDLEHARTHSTPTEARLIESGGPAVSFRHTEPNQAI